MQAIFSFVLFRLKKWMRWKTKRAVDLIKLSQTWKGYNPCCVCMHDFAVWHISFGTVSSGKWCSFTFFLCSFFSLTHFPPPFVSLSLFAPAPHRADDIQFSTMESDMFAQQWRSTISVLSSARQKVFVIVFAFLFFLEKKANYFWQASITLFGCFVFARAFIIVYFGDQAE